LWRLSSSCGGSTPRWSVVREAVDGHEKVKNFWDVEVGFVAVGVDDVHDGPSFAVGFHSLAKTEEESRAWKVLANNASCKRRDPARTWEMIVSKRWWWVTDDDGCWPDHGEQVTRPSKV
jgi:hypothetical protein